MKITRTKWSKEETDTLRRLVAENQFNTWGEIQSEINHLHSVNRGPQSCRAKWENLSGGLPSNAMSLKATPERQDYINACWGNNFSMNKIKKGFKEQFGRKIKTKEIYYMLQMGKDKEMKSMNNKDKKNDKMTTTNSRWTPKEDKIIGDSPTVNHAISRTASLQGRTVSSIRQRFYKLKKIQKADRLQAANMINNIDEAYKLSKSKILNKAPTGAVKPTKKNKKAYQIWTEEQDYDLVMNFYELSIDEACNRFNRSYGIIAKRLETIVNSTKPHHISLLMTATKEIKDRKKAESKPVKLGLLGRRKARKQTKRLAKNNRKIAKIEKKLNKMKGE